jgi:Domain of unknown function (DUF4158)
MKRAWHPEELVEHWTILPGEWPLIEHKHGATRLGFAVLFKFFQCAGAFPRAPQDVPRTVVDHIAQQVGVPADTWAQYAWDGRTIEYHRAQIRQHLGFREATVADGETLVTWLSEQIVSTTRRPDHLKEAMVQRCRDLRIEPPTPEQGKRIWKLSGFSVTVAASFTTRSFLHYWSTLYGYACAWLVSGAFCHVD